MSKDEYKSMKAPIVYGVILIALGGLLFLTSPSENLRKSLRGARKHGPRLKLTEDPGNYNVKLEHIPFDPVIAEIEQKREDASWEKAHESQSESDSPSKSGHLASGLDDFLDHHLEGDPELDVSANYDDGYHNYLEEGFNFTARIEALFPMIDWDGDGAIGLDEMWAWHRGLAKNQSMHRSDREMSVIVHGKQGKVELRDYLHDPKEGTEGAREWPEHNQQWVAASRRKFPLADVDGDGKLDRYEFDDFLHPEDSDNAELHQFVREEEIRERDTDGDGKLSFVEFLGGMYDALRDLKAEEEEDARSQGPDHRPDGPASDIDDRRRWRHPYGANATRRHRSDYMREQAAIADRRMQRARRKFDELDQNRDGFLTEDELIPVIDKLNPGESYFARLQAESLLNLADDNKDGSLSLAEMITHRHSFYRTIDEDDEIYIHDEF